MDILTLTLSVTILYTVIVVAFDYTSTRSDPVVNTLVGRLRGTTYIAFNSTINVFWSVPYARPPVGALRFQHPVEIERWTRILDATQKPNACYQIGEDEAWTLDVSESEDCLYLTIYTPAPLMSGDGVHQYTESCLTQNVTEREALMPVMFYIFGGAFVRVSSTRFNATALALLNNVVVVVINYRLGVFGHLYSGTSDAPGNAGVYDQLMALQWVHNNIKYFGGDPETITIFGGSAGAMSVGYLILSPLGRNLFNRAILLSATPNSPLILGVSQNAIDIAKRFVNVTGCNLATDSFRDAIVCLKELPAKTLDLVQESFSVNYRPIVDGHFFPKPIPELYDEAANKNVTVLLGVTEDEGNFLLAFQMKMSFAQSGNLTVRYDELRVLIDEVLTKYANNMSSCQREVVHYVYTNWEDVYDDQRNRQLAGRFIGDYLLVCPTSGFGNLLSKRGLEVYYYNFNHRSSQSIWPTWAGVTHGDDIDYIFGHVLNKSHGYTDEEMLLSRRIIHTFGNFARFGVPSFEGESWPLYNYDNGLYAEISLNRTDVKQGLRAKHCALWNELLPRLAKL